MKDYLKMSDVFQDKANHEHEGNFITIGKSKIADFGFHAALCSYAAHAINSHDELVSEVERLRKSLKWAIGNLPFEHPFEWSDEDSHDAHKEAIIASGGTYED